MGIIYSFQAVDFEWGVHLQANIVHKILSLIHWTGMLSINLILRRQTFVLQTLGQSFPSCFFERLHGTNRICMKQNAFGVIAQFIFHMYL